MLDRKNEEGSGGGGASSAGIVGEPSKSTIAFLNEIPPYVNEYYSPPAGERYELQRCLRAREARWWRARIRVAVRDALKRGWLVKPDRCQSCSAGVSGMHLGGHHRDYLRPFDVQWLCQRCHTIAHGWTPRKESDSRLPVV